MTSTSSMPRAAYSSIDARKPSGSATRVRHAQDRLLDGGGVAVLVGAVALEHLELVGDLGRLGGEEVAGVGVAGDQPEGLLLAAPPDQDRRAGAADRPRRADRLGQPVVGPLVGAVVVAPHLMADLQRLLEALEALGHRGERHAVGEVLPLVPRGPDAELGPALGHDVERGDDVGQEPRVPVGDARHHQAQADPLGAPGQEARAPCTPRAWARGGRRTPPSGSSGPSG